MDLSFKDACDGCGVLITWIDAAHICPDECTFCDDCAESIVVCPCPSELRRRPRRTRS